MTVGRNIYIIAIMCAVVIYTNTSCFVDGWHYSSM